MQNERCKSDAEDGDRRGGEAGEEKGGKAAGVGGGDVRAGENKRGMREGANHTIK